MQIHSIQLKNIKSHRDLELNFVPGINVLLGANGVGKSTIFEAVGYALFGVDAQSFVGKVERFISIGAKKGEIAIVFQPTGAERFRVSRTVGTPSKWLLAKQQGDGFEVEEHKDNKETEVRLKELLGLANGRSLAEQFELVIGPFQNDFLGPFVIKQPAKRRDKFDEILGIDSWRKTFTETNPLLKAIQNRIEVLQSAIGPLQDQVAHLPGKRAAHTAAKEQLVQIEAEWQKQQQVLQGMLAQLLQIDQRAELIKALQVEIDKLQERIANGMEKIGSQKSLIAEAEKAQQIVVENSAGKAAYEQAEKRLLTLREKQKQQRALEQQVAALDKQLGSLRAQYDAQRQAITQAAQELDNEAQALEEKRRTLVVDESMQALAARLPEIREAIQQLRSQLGQLEGRRVGLEEGNEKLAEGICPFFQEPCLNIAETPPGDLFSAKFAELAAQRKRMEDELNRMVEEEGKALAASDQLKAYQVQANGLNDQLVRLAAKRQDNQQRTAGLGQLQQDLAALERRLTEQQKALQGYGQLAQEIEASEAQQKKHQPARDLFVANQEQAGRLQERQAELQRYLQLLDQLQKELVDKQAQFASTSKDYDAAQHQQLWEQKDALAHEVGALGQKVENGKAELARLAAEIESLQELARQITAKQAQVKAFGAKEQLVKYLRNRVFRNVSGYLSERFREEISQRANRIYRIIAENDEELDWGEDYRIVLRDMVAGELRERSDDQLSGGQTMSAVVALRLAMLQTIGARLAFFDEPTSNLDASRRENLAHAFRAIDVGKEEVTEHWYDQLFLISHDVAFSEVTDQIIPLD